MTDEQTPEVDPTTPEPPRQGPGLLRIYLGRIVTVLYAFTAVSASLLTVVADLDLTSTVGVIGGLAALAPVVIKFLEGVQNYEKAGYNRDHTILQAQAQAEVIRMEAAAAEEIGGRRASPAIARPGR
jgi:hypothetical protein